jgi:hypothetical protein
MSFNSRDEAKIWVFNNQLGRRNLSDAMRIEIALLKCKLMQCHARANQSQGGGDRKSESYKSEKSPENQGESLLLKPSKLVDGPINIRNSIAEEANVSESTVHNYMKLKEKAGPELLEQVKKGEIKIGAAHRQLEHELTREMKWMGMLYKVIGQHIPFKDNKEANQEVLTRLEGLHKKLRDMMLRIGGIYEKGA